MYKEKLLSQMAFLEKLQGNCGVIYVNEAIELGRQIVMLAKQIDEVEKSKPDNVTVK